MTTLEMSPPEPVQDPSGYPIRLSITRPEKQSRLTNFPLGIGTIIRTVLLIPQFIVLYLVQIVAVLLYFIATFAILFTGRYPVGMYKFVVGYVRWNANVTGYMNSLYDKYPAFSSEQRPDYPLTLEVDYTDHSSKLLNFPLFGFFIKELLAIPHLIVLAALGIVAFIAIFIAKFAILFTGSYPEGIHRFVVGTMRWSVRINSYFLGLTDKYPPFSLS